MSPTKLSVVIPVFNGEQTVESVVQDCLRDLSNFELEIILVNDGSRDKSEEVCRQLFDEHPETLKFVNLSRNFGEHNAVLAGICHTSGDVVAIIDDDGQNPPAEISKLVKEIEKGVDVAYGHYISKKHDLWRNLGSQLNDAMANLLLGKPKHVYLSSFKSFNRFVADQLKLSTTPYPYIDSLIFQCTQNIAQVDVEHKSRETGKSNYTLRRLVLLWSNMLTTSSILPLRLATYIGLTFAGLGFLAAFAILIEYLFFSVPVQGWASTSMAIVIFSGLQLFALGIVGEYVGRIFQSGHRKPFIVKDVYSSDSPS